VRACDRPRCEHRGQVLLDSGREPELSEALVTHRNWTAAVVSDQARVLEEVGRRLMLDDHLYPHVERAGRRGLRLKNGSEVLLAPGPEAIRGRTIDLAWVYGSYAYDAAGLLLAIDQVRSRMRHAAPAQTYEEWGAMDSEGEVVGETFRRREEAEAYVSWLTTRNGGTYRVCRRQAPPWLPA
jgi:hypothetical protein